MHCPEAMVTAVPPEFPRPVLSGLGDGLMEGRQRGLPLVLYVRAIELVRHLLDKCRKLCEG